MYRWCSCGMSRAQPLCDGSHVGTKFKPLKFRIEEETDSIYLCGWKLSTVAPFWDGKTCERINNKTFGQQETVHQIQEPKIIENDQEK